MIITCLLAVFVHVGGDNDAPLETVQTAVVGRVLVDKPFDYLADFSEYAVANRYVGDYTNIVVSKDACTEGRLLK